jgi:hypothetical protein
MPVPPVNLTEIPGVGKAKPAVTNIVDVDMI